MEIAIVARAKQGYIYRYLIENHITSSELAGRIGIDCNTMSQIINFRWIPRRRKPGGVADRLEKYFHIPVEMLFPPELTEDVAKKLRGERVEIREVSAEALDCASIKLLTNDPEEMAEKERIEGLIPSILATLTCREEKCLRLRFGIGGEAAERVGPAMDISAPVRKLRNPSRRRLLRKAA